VLLPHASPLYTCLTKVTRAEGNQLKYGPNWILARRARLKLFEGHLICGDWNIPYSAINKAVLYSIRSTFFIPGYVLKLETSEKTYHFGLNCGTFWKGDLPFPVERKRGKLKYSIFSIIARIIVIAYLIYWLVFWLTT